MISAVLNANAEDGNQAQNLVNKELEDLFGLLFGVGLKRRYIQEMIAKAGRILKKFPVFKIRKKKRPKMRSGPKKKAKPRAIKKRDVLRKGDIFRQSTTPSLE